MQPNRSSPVPNKWLSRRILIISLILSAFIFYIYIQRGLDPISLIPESVRFLHIWNNTPSLDNGTEAGANATSATPLILVWTKYFSNTWTGLIPLFENCPVHQRCNITFDRSLLNQSSVVIFHIRNLAWSDIPPASSRRADQYYVFALWESPDHTYLDLSQHPDFFNLTLTYRRDSDGVWPYGNFIKTAIPSSNSSLSDSALHKVITGKSKMIAWFVSNCRTPSRREVFVRRLQAFLPVDIYGGCGKLTCPRGRGGGEVGFHDATPCQQLLTKDYKFYLSLENSLCRDYVTEKFYSILDNALVIPVVLERNLVLAAVKDPEAARVLNQSIIAVDDFPNVQALADFLRYLDQNVTEYLRYFEWRKSFQVDIDRFMHPGCDLCALVKSRKPRIIDNIGKWWNDKAECHNYN